MNFKKKAFTLTEILVVLVFVGFIIIAQLSVLMKKVDDYSAPYYTAYNAVKKTAYNILADIHCPDCSNSGLQGLPACTTSHICPDIPRRFPETSQQLCERMTEWINASRNNCSNMTPVTKNGNRIVIDANRPHFVASNSFRFWIHDHRQTSNIQILGQEKNFFIVYVDLNGEKNPNRLECNESDIMPDIVPFVITPRGDAIPLGFPVYSKKYMTATVKLPDTMRQNASGQDELSTDEKTLALTFYEAVRGAWPNAGTTGVVQEHNVPLSIQYDELEPAINSSITSCYNTTLGANSSNTVTKANYQNTARSMLEAKGLLAGNTGCKGGEYTCRVSIDKHKTSRY